MSSHSVNDLRYYHCGVVMAPVYGSVTNSNMILCVHWSCRHSYNKYCNIVRTSVLFVLSAVE